MAERRRIEGSFNQGWPIAALIVGMTIACFVGAYAIHTKIYRSPNDVTATSEHISSEQAAKH